MANGTHLIAPNVQPPGTRVQRQHLVDHGSYQCQGLWLMGVQRVGEGWHFPEVCEHRVLQYKLWRQGGQAH